MKITSKKVAKTANRLFALLLTVLMLGSLFPLAAIAEGEEPVDTILSSGLICECGDCAEPDDEKGDPDGEPGAAGSAPSERGDDCACDVCECSELCEDGSDCDCTSGGEDESQPKDYNLGAFDGGLLDDILAFSGLFEDGEDFFGVFSMVAPLSAGDPTAERTLYDMQMDSNLTQANFGGQGTLSGSQQTMFPFIRRLSATTLVYSITEGNGLKEFTITGRGGRNQGVQFRTNDITTKDDHLYRLEVAGTLGAEAGNSARIIIGGNSNGTDVINTQSSANGIFSLVGVRTAAEINSHINDFAVTAERGLYTIGTGNSANANPGNTGSSSNFVINVFRIIEVCPVECGPNGCHGGTQAAQPSGIGRNTVTEFLTGFANNTPYKVGNITINSNASGEIPIQNTWFGTEVEIIRLGTGLNTNSESTKYTVAARPAVPSDVNKTDTTGGLNNGTITGVTTAMQYKLISNTTWLAITGTSVTGLAAGTYHVRTAPVAGTSFGSLPTANLVIELSSGCNADCGLCDCFICFPTDGKCGTCEICDPPPPGYEKVIYNIQTDSNLKAVEGKSTGPTGTLITAYRSGQVDFSIDMNVNPRVIQLTKRSSANGGLDINIEVLLGLTKPLHSYRFDIAGITASTNATNAVVFGQNTDRTASLGTTALASASISSNRNFELSATLTREEIQAFYSAGTTTRSYRVDCAVTNLLFDINKFIITAICPSTCNDCIEICSICTVHPCVCTTRLARPAATIDYSTETLRGLTAGAEYTVNGTSCIATGGIIPIDTAWMGTTVSIIRLHPIKETLDSQAQSLAIPPRLETPTTVSKVDTTNGINNGKLTGISSRMEFKLVTATSWSDVFGMYTTEEIGLAAGTYHVRFKATTTAFASLPTANLVIGSSTNTCTHRSVWSNPGTGVVQIDTNNHILKLTLSSETQELIKDADEIELTFERTIPSTRTASARRLYAWTNLDGATPTVETIAFTSNGIRVDHNAIDTSLSVSIPKTRFINGTTVASTIYIAITTNTTDVAAIGNHRGGGSDNEHSWSHTIVLSAADNCSACKACLDCQTCACAPRIFPLPLHKAPDQDWGENARGWSEAEFDSPTGITTATQKRTERRDGGIRYLVVDFKEAPTYGWDFIIQNNETGEAGVGWRVYKVRSTAMQSQNNGTRFVIDFDSLLPPTGQPPCPAGCTQNHTHNQERFEGFNRRVLYTQFQMVFDANPAWGSGGVSFAAFLANIERAYFTNNHPSTFPSFPTVNVPGVTVGAGPELRVNATDREDLILTYNGTLSGVDAVRMQYSIDGGVTWINIESSFSIITESGARKEFLPRETYNQSDLRIRWIPHGVWGRTWAQTGGSYAISNVRLTCALQIYESPRAISPVLAINELASPPSSIPQRESTTLTAPGVTLRPNAPSAASTAVTWTSSDATVAKVLGGVIRALNPGTTTIRVASVADPTVYTEFVLTVGGPIVPTNQRANFVVTSPYDNVNWSWTQYKAGIHNHDLNSDGANSLASSAERHYALGYSIVAFTNHDRLMQSPDAAEVQSGRPGSSSTGMVDAKGMLTTARFNEMQSGVGRGGAGMLFVPGTNEESLGLRAMTQAPTSHHVNTYWANQVRSGSGQQIDEFLGDLNPGALARLNHPGRYTGSEWPMQPWSLAEAIANNSSNFMPYVNLIVNTETGAHLNRNLIGMEIINKFDTESQADRVLWDNILSMSMPHGRPFWGFSDDDAHSNQAIGFSFNLMLMPSLSLENFKSSMQNGAFFAFSRVDRQYGIYAGQISQWDWDGGGSGENRPARVDATRDLPEPRINSISVEGNNIIIDAAISGVRIDAGSNFIAWHADGVEIHRGHTLNLREHQMSIYSYVRATVVTSNGVLYTQPFAISRGEDCVVNCVCADCMAGSDVNLLLDLGIPEVFVYQHSCMHNGGPSWNNWCNGVGSRPNNPDAVDCWRQGDMLPQQAFWTAGNATRLQAWKDASILVINMNQRPTDLLQLIWEDEPREFYWQNAVLVSSTGELANGVTWDGAAGRLIIHLPTVFAGPLGTEKPGTYTDFLASTVSLRVFIEYFAADIGAGNTIVQALGIKGAQLLGAIAETTPPPPATRPPTVVVTRPTTTQDPEDTGPQVQLIESNGGAVMIPYFVEDGKVVLVIDEATIEALIDSARDGIVHFDVSNVTGATAVTIPSAAIIAMAEAGLAVEIDMPQGSILLDGDALASLIDQLGGDDFTLTLFKILASDLSSEMQDAIEPGDVVFRITIESADQYIRNFDGTLTITVPWNGSFPAVVWYLDEDGNMTRMETLYDEVAGTVTFITNHLSVYVIRHEPLIEDDHGHMDPPIVQAPGPQLPPQPAAPPSAPGGSNMWLWFAAITAAIVLAGGGVIYVVLRKRSKAAV